MKALYLNLNVEPKYHKALQKLGLKKPIAEDIIRRELINKNLVIPTEEEKIRLGL